MKKKTKSTPSVLLIPYNPSMDRDDLLQLSTMTPEMEMVLNSIGIRKFSDFRKFTPEDISDMLNWRTGVFLSVEKIKKQQWFEQAQILSQNYNQNKEEEIMDQEKTERNGLKSAGKDPSKNVKAKTEKINKNNDKQVAVKNKDKAEKKVSPATPKTADENLNRQVLSIIETKFNQVESSLHKGKFTIHGEVTIKKEEANTDSKKLDKAQFCIQILAENQESHKIKLLATEFSRLGPDKNIYSSRLNFTPPEPGLYRLYIVAYVFSDRKIFDFHSGPLLRVVKR